MSNVLIDTNILLYAIDNNSPHQRQSQDMLNDTSLEMFTTSKNISELYCAATKGDQPIISIDDALRVVRHYRTILQILYPIIDSSQMLDTLLQRYQPRGLKIHDYEIAAITLAHGITQIVTFNEKDFVGISEIQVINPANL